MHLVVNSAGNGGILIGCIGRERKGKGMEGGRELTVYCVLTVYWEKRKV